ncbi:AAA family ATPase [Gordonia terrae]|uniref:AAA family ATPase n=1 Tax=Gordonia terrae TaxID=2055 RepID=UPI0012FE6481|nr:AAA family ATPase [Gordonia terrae]
MSGIVVNGDAAQAYAAAGFYVLPVKPGTKNPGSVVGKGWHEKSSRDPVVVRRWWGRNPDYGIALHVGRSGLVVFDLDKPLADLPDELVAALRQGVSQRSRRADSSNPDRGHYLFVNDGNFGNSAGAFAQFGEVRGKNGVIIVAPTEHVDNDGEYRWVKTGPVPRLPKRLRECLREASGVQAAPLARQELTDFLDSYVDSARPELLEVPLDKFSAMVAEGMSRHDALVKVIPMAYRDAMAGLYPAREATERLRAAFEDAFRPDDGDENELKGRRRRPDDREFQATAAWAAAQVVSTDPSELRERKARLIGSEDDVALAREAFAPGGMWHPDNPKGNVYRLHRRGQRADPPPQDDGRQFTQSLAQVTPTKVQWLWHPWIPLGKLTIFEGEPDVGKSTMTLKLAAMVSNGGPWPRVDISGDTSRNEKGLTAPASVVLVGVEDDLADTVVPRLRAAKADLDHVSAMARPRDANGQPIPFLVPDDVDKLRRAIEEVDAKLVVIDPISAFMSDAVKPGSDTANRKALMTLADVAEQTGAAIVLVRHLNKGTGMSAKHRGGGSIAFTALARSVLLAAKLDPSEDRENTNATHALASTKGNLARAPKTMGYELRSSPSDPDSPVVRWAGVLEESADQLVGADGAKTDARTSAPARDEAERLIREMLADGPRDAKEVRRAVAAEAGCSERTVTNAAKRLLVNKTPVRRGESMQIDHWTWSLPGRMKPGDDSNRTGSG